jgi:competence ComEA-like helix-hairpin-helix protein
MFNRQEQQALLSLTAALLVGSMVAVGDGLRSAVSEDFRVIPRAVEPPPPLEVGIERQGPISLNSTTAVELIELPGVGIKTAALIVDFRGKHGPFERVEQLLQIKGIGLRTLEKLRPLLKIE